MPDYFNKNVSVFDQLTLKVVWQLRCPVIWQANNLTIDETQRLEIIIFLLLLVKQLNIILRGQKHTLDAWVGIGSVGELLLMCEWELHFMYLWVSVAFDARLRIVFGVRVIIEFDVRMVLLMYDWVLSSMYGWVLHLICGWILHSMYGWASLLMCGWVLHWMHERVSH